MFAFPDEAHAFDKKKERIAAFVAEYMGALGFGLMPK